MAKYHNPIELDPNSISPPDVPQATIDAIDGVHKLEELAKAIAMRIANLAAELAEAKKELSALALDAEVDASKDADYRAAVTNAERLSYDHQRAANALPGVYTRLETARNEVASLGRSQNLAIVEKYTQARAVATKQMVAGIAEYAEGFKRLNEINRRLRISWPYPRQPRGGMLHDSEFMVSLSNELWRHSAIDYVVQNLGDNPQHQLLPGSSTHVILGGDPSRMKSFLEEMEEKNAYLLRVVRETPLATDQGALTTVGVASVPVTSIATGTGNEEVDTTLSVALDPIPAGPVRSAQEILAEINSAAAKRSRRVVYGTPEFAKGLR